MDLTLDNEHADELRSALDGILSDLSAEIADTDNAAYRRALRQRRIYIADIREQLGSPPSSS